MLSFDNTEIAFKSKSNFDLTRSYLLFSLISRPWMVSAGKKITEFALKIKLPINPFIRFTIFKQFCGGVNIDDCDKTIKQLSNYKIGTILDYSVEGKTENKQFEETVNEIIATIHKAKNNGNIPFCVFKVSGITKMETLINVSNEIIIGNKVDNSFFTTTKRVHTLCKEAFTYKIPIFIDAEETWIQPAIDYLANEMMEKFNKETCIVYNTFQMYRKDRLDYLKANIEDAKAKKYIIGAKIVRGAYMEKERKRAEVFQYESPIHDTKENTDEAYDAAVAYCLDNIDHVAICAGTHNENSSIKLFQAMIDRNIPSNHKHVYFSQLLGMSDHLSFNLSNEGLNVAKYVPYGPIKEVLPYLFRRAEENTSVKGQTGRELNLIIKEQKRRRSKAAD